MRVGRLMAGRLQTDGRRLDMGAKELLEQALKLAPDERFALADQVLHSLDRPGPAIDAVWLKEAEHRLAAHRAGKVEDVPAEVIFGDIG